MLNVHFVHWGLSASLDLGSGTWQTSVANSLWPHCPYTRLDTEAVFCESFRLSLNHITGYSLAIFSTYGVCFFLEHIRIFYVTFHFTERVVNSQQLVLGLEKWLSGQTLAAAFPSPEFI